MYLGDPVSSTKRAARTGPRAAGRATRHSPTPRPRAPGRPPRPGIPSAAITWTARYFLVRDTTSRVSSIARWVARSWSLQLGDPLLGPCRLCLLAAGQSRFDAAVDALPPPPGIDRLITDAQVMCDLGHRSTGLDQAQNLAPELRRIPTSSHTTLHPPSSGMKSNNSPPDNPGHTRPSEQPETLIRRGTPSRGRHGTPTHHVRRPKAPHHGGGESTGIGARSGPGYSSVRHGPGPGKVAPYRPPACHTGTFAARNCPERPLGEARRLRHCDSQYEPGGLRWLVTG